MKTCPFCAEEIQDQAIVCKHCGRDLKGGASQVQLVQPKKQTGCVAGGCAVVLAGLAVMFIVGKLSSPTVAPLSSPTVAPPRQAQTTTAKPAPPAARTAVTPRTIPPDALLLAIRSAGFKCRAASRTFYQGAAKDGAAFWNVQCGEGAYAVQVSNDRKLSTRVMECATMAAVSKVNCFVPFGK